MSTMRASKNWKAAWTVDDLKKVPGLDAAKVEARKERMEF
jgi:hypothetical protein